MIRIITFDSGESLFPIAIMAAESDEEYRAELDRFRERIADAAVEKERETFDADADLDELDRTAKYVRLDEVRLHVTGAIGGSWDELPLIHAGEPEKAHEEKLKKAYAMLEEWELLEGL